MNKLIFKLFGNQRLSAVLALVFLSACSYSITGNAAGIIPKENGILPQVYFCPKDDCGKELESYIKSANFSAYCALYDIDLKNVINALAKKSKTADVRVVMDSSNYNGQIKGDAVRMDNDEQLMHNKFCIIDSRIVLTGSFNPTDNDNNYNNNNLVVLDSGFLAENYKDEFDELWSGKFGQGPNVKYPVIQLNDFIVENYFCPEDRCASHVISLIENAKSSVYFMSFSFTSQQIADALVSKKNLDVRGIFDAKQSSNKFSQLKKLSELGLNVKKDKNKYTMHHKVFIIDNQTVVTGSFNPTSSADTKNDENLLIIHDKKIADIFLEEFDGLWS